MLCVKFMKIKKSNATKKSSIKESIADTCRRLVPTDTSVPSSIKLINYSMILYEDTDDYNINDVIKKLVDYCNENEYLYCYIKHDKDYYQKNTYDDHFRLIGKLGDKKKTHYHFLICQNSYSYLTDIATRFGIKQNLITKCKYPTNMIIYFSHKYERNKHEYPITSIKTNRENYINYIYDEYKAPVMNLLKKLLETDETIFLKDLINYCDDNNLEYKSQYQVIKDLIYEHNNYIKSRYKEALDINIEKARHEIAKENYMLEKMTSTFDRVRLDNGDEIMLIKHKKEKK